MTTLSERERAVREKAAPPYRPGNPGLAGLSPDAVAAMRADALPASPPDRVVRLAPSAWSEKWVDRPVGPVDVGVMRIGEAHQMAARSDAVKTANRLHPDVARTNEDWLLTYNQAVMLNCVAAALCNPKNRHQALWPMQAELFPSRITTAGLERLFDELELVTVIEGPTRPEASDQQLAELGEDLTTGAFWQDMPVARARHLRRLLAFVIDLSTEPIVTLQDP